MSYGVTGSTAISPYSTQNTLRTENVVFDKNTTVAYVPSDTYTGDLKWETTSQFNVGVDLSLFNNRLRMTADYYRKKTTDLLNNVEMPRSSGYTTALRNIGSIRNSGFELQLDGRIIDRAVKWDLGVNFSLNRSKVLVLSEDKDIFGGELDNTILKDQLNLMRVGEPMYVFYGYVEDGYDENGHIVYKNMDDDPAITAADKTIIGDPNPDFLVNLTTAVSYKGFTLSAFFQSSIGKIYIRLVWLHKLMIMDITGIRCARCTTTIGHPKILPQNIPILTRLPIKCPTGLFMTAASSG